MKKYLSLVLIALVIITAGIFLFSCSDEDEVSKEVILEELEKVSFKDKIVVYNGKPKNLTVTTRLQYNRLPYGIKVKYEGNGNVEVGEYTVTAKFLLDGVEIPEAQKTAKITIKKAIYDLTESTKDFKNTTVSYNGQVQTLKIDERYLPEGVSVTYDYHGQEPKVAGEYQITAKFTHTNEKNYEPIPDQTVTLTIERKIFDTEGIEFNPTFAIFDGSEKNVEISGTLPEGLYVEYEGNGVISIGTHTVYAKFWTDDPNYQAPEPMKTTLVILNEDYHSGGLGYGLAADGNSYMVTNYTGEANYLIIPESYNEKPITSIASRVFEDATFKYVYMPDSITTLESNVFRNCLNLEELHLSSNLESIGIGTFRGCEKLRIVDLPEKITEIPNYCFAECVSLTSVSFGNKVESIGSYAFNECAKLEKIFIPKSVKSITADTLRKGPFVGTAENFMIVLEGFGITSEFEQYWANISETDETKKALVLYSQTYDDFMTNYNELREKAAETISISTAENIVLGSTPLAGFKPDVIAYTTLANAYFGYPTVSASSVSPAATVQITQATVLNGGVATVTITSSDGSSETTYTITFKALGDPENFEPSAQIVNKNGTDAVVSYVIDDGYEDTATFAKSMLLKYNNLSFSFAIWTKDFATLQEATDSSDGKKYYVMDNGKYVYSAVNQYKINYWNDILNGVGDRAEIVSHTHTHAPWGVNDDGGEYTYVDNSNNIKQLTVPKGSFTKEFYASQQIISDLFPQMRNVALIEPGIGVKTTDYVSPEGQIIPTYHTYFKQLLSEAIENNRYIGSRSTFHTTSNYENYVIQKEQLQDINFRMQIPGFMVRPDDPVFFWTDYIDAAIEKGGWAPFCIHEIDSTPSGRWYISENDAEELFKYTNDKNVWVATFTDALLYYIEWGTAEVTSTYDKEANRIQITLTDQEEENDIFNMPLTVKVSVPTIWKSVSDGTNEIDVKVNADGSKYVYVDVVPDAEPVYLTPLS